MADYENPFDRPLESEVSEHQQAHAATIAASDNGNPFTEPLMSEKAEAQAEATAAQTHLFGERLVPHHRGLHLLASLADYRGFIPTHHQSLRV